MKLSPHRLVGLICVCLAILIACIIIGLSVSIVPWNHLALVEDTIKPKVRRTLSTALSTSPPRPLIHLFATPPPSPYPPPPPPSPSQPACPVFPPLSDLGRGLRLRPPLHRCREALPHLPDGLPPRRLLVDDNGGLLRRHLLRCALARRPYATSPSPTSSPSPSPTRPSHTPHASRQAPHAARPAAERTQARPTASASRWRSRSSPGYGGSTCVRCTSATATLAAKGATGPVPTRCSASWHCTHARRSSTWWQRRALRTSSASVCASSRR